MVKAAKCRLSICVPDSASQKTPSYSPVGNYPKDTPVAGLSQLFQKTLKENSGHSNYSSGSREYCASRAQKVGTRRKASEQNLLTKCRQFFSRAATFVASCCHTPNAQTTQRREYDNPRHL